MLNKPTRIAAVIVLLALSLALGWNITQASDGGSKALVRVEIDNQAALERFASLDIPVYAQLWGNQGETYLLVTLDSPAQALLEQLGYPTRTLDPDAAGATYYLAYAPPPGVQVQVPAQVVILETADQYILVRADPVAAEALTTLGFEIQRLWEHALVLPPVDKGLKQIYAPPPDPYIQAMIDQVQNSTAHDYVGDLSGEWQIEVNGNPYTLLTRYSYATIPIKKATRFVYEHFVDLGLNTYYDTFYIYTTELRSVIAEQPGLTNPDCIVLVTAHLDDTSNNPYVDAPGADDNASGSTGVLIAADILHQYQFECTIRYVHFTGEEQGLYGSWAYAEEVYNNGENVIAVVNLDMLGYNGDPYEKIELHTRNGNAGDTFIADLFADVIQSYDINLTPLILADGKSFSDHYPFWSYGYSAILAIEDWTDHTPYYHTTGDDLDSLDISYLSDFIRAAVGTVAHLARPIPPELEQHFFPLITR